MREFIYQIVVDHGRPWATANVVPDTAPFNAGDQVRFQSDCIGTVITYPGQTPFQDLAAGEKVHIPADGPSKAFTLKLNVPHLDDYHFDCGQCNGSHDFNPWPGGNTPKPPIGG